MCPACGGRLGLKLARTGGFIGCANYPTCRHARPLGVVGDANGDHAADMAGAAQATGVVPTSSLCRSQMLLAFLHAMPDTELRSTPSSKLLQP